MNKIILIFIFALFMLSLAGAVLFENNDFGNLCEQVLPFIISFYCMFTFLMGIINQKISTKGVVCSFRDNAFLYVILTALYLFGGCMFFYFGITSD